MERYTVYEFFEMACHLKHGSINKDNIGDIIEEINDKGISFKDLLREFNKQKNKLTCDFHYNIVEFPSNIITYKRYSAF